MPIAIRRLVQVLGLILFIGTITYTVVLAPGIFRVVKKKGLSDPAVMKGVVAYTVLAIGSSLLAVATIAGVRAELRKPISERSDSP